MGVSRILEKEAHAQNVCYTTIIAQTCTQTFVDFTSENFHLSVPFPLKYRIIERKSLDEPIGLKCIGNDCWFNSIIQALYTLSSFRRLVLNFQYSTLNCELTENVR